MANVVEGVSYEKKWIFVEAAKPAFRHFTVFIINYLLIVFNAFVFILLNLLVINNLYIYKNSCQKKKKSGFLKHKNR